ncbi:hypothetical protein CRUP_023360 [Coryphaenoides rupestris]|nr:hypothetical protein CRUP_023360 [Coryphaenoides rupestris]
MAVLPWSHIEPLHRHLNVVFREERLHCQHGLAPATSSTKLEDLSFLDEQRNAPLRTSMRLPWHNTGGRPPLDSKAPQIASQLATEQAMRNVKKKGATFGVERGAASRVVPGQTHGGAQGGIPLLIEEAQVLQFGGAVRLAPYKPVDIMLKPLLFEVPSITMDSVFVGRDWLFQQLEALLKEGGGGGGGGGAVVVGSVGYGKTAIVSRLVVEEEEEEEEVVVVVPTPPPSTSNTLRNPTSVGTTTTTTTTTTCSSSSSSSSSGTPEAQRHKEEAVKRLAAKTLVLREEDHYE